MSDLRLDWFFAKEFTGVTKKWSAAQRWRLKSGGDEDDLFQEAWLVFRRVVDRYPHATSRRHVMRLYQTSLFRRAHDLAAKEWVVPEMNDETGEPVDPDSCIGSGQEELEWAVTCLSAPVAVLEALKRLVTVNPKLLHHRRYVADPLTSRRTRRSKMVRETTTEMLARVLGPSKVGAVAQLRTLLREG